MDGYSVQAVGVSPCPKGGKLSSTPTTGGSEAFTQEMKPELPRYSSKDLLDSSYSDNIGFPTLPRPKAILSLSCGSRPALQAAHLDLAPPNKSPVSPSSNRRNGWLKDKKLEGLHPVATTSVNKVNNNSLLSRARLAEQTGTGSASNSTNGVAALSSSCCVAEDIPLARPRRSSSVSSPSESRKQAMNSRSRVMSRKVQPPVAAATEEDLSATGRNKKTKKSSRSMTFSFGSNSERKKRALAFLGKGEKKSIQDKVSVMPPDSPILVTRKTKTMPMATGCTELPVPDKGWREEHLKHNGNGPHKSGSYQDISKKVASPQLGHKYRPPNLSLSSSARSYSTAGDEESPILLPEYSPTQSSTSGLSSFRNSPESVYNGGSCCETSGSLVATPSGKKLSPHPSPLHNASCRLEDGSSQSCGDDRRLPDRAAPSTPEPQRHRDGHSGNVGSRGIKKRYTFCVRPSQSTKQPKWVSVAARVYTEKATVEAELQQEMREHVVKFLVETEQSYVESLRRILKVYYEPLKRPQAAALVDSALVGEIFYQIPEICSIHERLLQQLTIRVKNWDSEKKIGDIFVGTFSKCQLMEVYSKFIGNFMRAKASIETAKQAKSVFAKFLEQKARDSEGKLSLDDLLIKPVQRIPRYVLFIKDLLKHTGPSHPDHAPLQKALGELTMLAERFNDREKERERLGHHRELVNSVDGLAQLLSPHSYFIRYDMITELKGQIHKRDRFLILFSDILVCASSRRKSSSFKRSSMLNLNSVFSDGLKYTIKWHVPLTKSSVGETPAVMFDQRKLNSLEKVLENLQKDEKVLEQLMELSTSISHPHQGVVTALRDLHGEIRESITSKKEELENLPQECSRMDLIGYASATPTQYSIIFPSQKIRQSWEEEFLQAKKMADNEAPPYASVAPPTSPFPVGVSLCQELEFRNSSVLQSGRIGTVLTCAAEGLTVDPSGVSCLWVCSNDRLCGKVSLLSLQVSSQPHLTGNITVSDSPITCITAVPRPSSPPSSSSQLPPSSTCLQPPRDLLAAVPPDISINSTSSSSSNSSSPHLYRRNISPAHSIGSAGGDKDDDMMFLDGELDLNLPDSDSNEVSFAGGNSLSVNSITRVRSNSAPPYPTTEDGVTRGVGVVQWNIVPDSSETPGSSQRPCFLRESGGRGQSMWLGTEEGQVLVYSGGDNIRSQSCRRVLDFHAAVQCISSIHGNILVGLETGTVCVLESSSPSSPRHDVQVGKGSIHFCLNVMGDVWVGCGAAIYRLDLHTRTTKRLSSLPSGQSFHSAVSCGNSVWVSLQRSSLLHLLHAPSAEVIASVDCTKPVMDVLKSYNPIIRQHKSASLQVTSLQLGPSHLMVGTSAGIVLAVPLPYIEPSLEAYYLVDAPVPTPLNQGHVDSVHFLTVVARDDNTLVITGGNGCEDFFKSGMSPEIPETASCMLVWNIRQ